MQKTDMEIQQDSASGKIDHQTCRRLTSLLKTHTSMIEKICVFTMKCIKQGFKDFNKLVLRYGTTENLDNEENGE